MRRDSAIMPALRFLQDKYQHAGFLDRLVQPFFNEASDIALLCVLAPPRSGSTLTYQVLASAFSGYSLRNLSNFLFATPLLGYIAAKKFCRKYTSPFCSEKGFVPGICGEAEGMKFWQHWLGQGLEQRPELLNVERLRTLKTALGRTGESLMITGYLGHVFAISALREVFPKALFIHLQRDLLSNAYSLFKATFEHAPFSTCPTSVKEKHHDNNYRLVVDQIRRLHEIISAEASKDMMVVNYENLCDDPHGTLQHIEQKAEELGINLSRKDEVPKSFSKQVIAPSHNEHSVQLHQIITETLNS